MTIAQKIGEYSDSLRYGDLSETTVKSTKRLMLDALGCAIGANNQVPVNIAREVAKNANAKYSATLLGTSHKTDPSYAGFVNGTMARYFDYNDTYLSKEPAHPSDNIFPVLAVAEASKRSGKDAILGIALAYEVQCRLCDSAMLWKKGWDHVNYGLVSTATAASKLMKSSPEETTHAINLALNSHVTMRQVRAGELSMWKAFSFSNSARNGIFCAMLANHGMTGPAPIFEGEMGFFKQVSGPFEVDFLAFGKNKSHFLIDECIIKYFPAEIHSQTAIWCALEARKELKSIDDVDTIEIRSHEAGWRIIGKDPEKWNPKTRETADHSIAYIMLAALMDGKIEENTFKEKRFRDKKTLEILQRVTVVENPEFTALYPKKGIANEIIVKLKSGKTITKRVIYPRGHPMNPISDAEVENKFRTLTKRYLSQKQADEIIKMVWSFEKVKDVAKLFSLCKLK